MKPIQSAAVYCVATLSQSGSFPPFHSFSFIHCRFLMVCLPSMGLLRTANKVNCFIYVLNYALLIKIVQTNLNDLCSKDTSKACWTPGNVACEIKKSHKLYLFTLSFSALIFPQWIQTARLQLWTSHMGHGSRLDSEWTLPFFHQMQLQKYWLLSERLPLSSIVWPNWLSPQTHTMSQCWVGLDSQCFINARLSKTTTNLQMTVCAYCAVIKWSILHLKSAHFSFQISCLSAISH